MDVSKMSDSEKSVLLARAVGEPLSSSLFHNLYDPAADQRAWLDKILELVIDAGLISPGGDLHG